MNESYVASLMAHSLTFPDIPTNHYITGFKVAKAFIGTSVPVRAPDEASVWMRLKLNGLSDPFSAWKKKDSQAFGPYDHGDRGLITGETDVYTYGSYNDLWGNAWGKYSPEQLNQYGMVVEAYTRQANPFDSPNTADSVDPFNPGNWQVTIVFEGVSTQTDDDGVVTEDVWDPTPVDNIQISGDDHGIGGTNTVDYHTANVKGYVTFTCEWVGGGPAPLWVDLTITIGAYASVRGDDTNADADNGIGEAQVVLGVNATAEVVGSTTVRLDIDESGNTVDSYSVPINVSATTTGVISGGTPAGHPASARVEVSAEPVGGLGSPVVSEVVLDVIHVAACKTNKLGHVTALPSGTWNTIQLGASEGLAVTSDDTSNGLYSLQMGDYNINIPDTAKVVGIGYSFDVRRSIYTGDFDNIGFRIHTGVFDDGLPYTNYTLPNTTSWTSVDIGGLGSNWGHETIDSLTGNVVGSITGADINDLLLVELRGTNVPGLHYEFKNMVVVVYYVNVE